MWRPPPRLRSTTGGPGSSVGPVPRTARRRPSPKLTAPALIRDNGPARGNHRRQRDAEEHCIRGDKIVRARGGAPTRRILDPTTLTPTRSRL